MSNKQNSKKNQRRGDGRFNFAAWLKILAVVGPLLVGIVAVARFGVDVWIDKASISIDRVEFDPVLPVANNRMRIVFTLKNTGRHNATIEGMATDRWDKLPSELRYERALLVPTEIPTGGELRVISDLGTMPLIFSVAEINSLKKGNTNLRIVGFVNYTGSFRWILGGTVLGFCYVWDYDNTSIGNFGSCPDKQFTYRRDYWILDGIIFQEVQMITIGTQTVTPTVAPMRFPDPRFPIKKLEIRK